MKHWGNPEQFYVDPIMQFVQDKFDRGVDFLRKHFEIVYDERCHGMAFLSMPVINQGIDRWLRESMRNVELLTGGDFKK